MLKLAFKNLFAHPVRSLLTIGALGIATFLVCFLASLVTALESGVSANSVRRLWTQTAVSLFSTMPLSYEQKIEALPGVEDAVKFQWFGGYYQDRTNFFGQFAADPDGLITSYPEVVLADDGRDAGSIEDWMSNRRGALIGDALADRFGWEVGQTIPLIAPMFAVPGLESWEFEISAIYTTTKPYVERGNMFFHWDYFERTLEEASGEAPECGLFVCVPDDGADLDAVSASIDTLFAGGPMRTQTTTESEFQRQFVGMIGSLPRFLTFLGSGVFIAILLACINTMLMAMREQTNDVGVLKALGFSDGRVFVLMLTQGLLLCALGGSLGLLAIKGSEPGFRDALATMFPGYGVDPSTLVGGAIAILAVGLLAGLIPAIAARRMSPVEALRTTV